MKTHIEKAIDNPKYAMRCRKKIEKDLMQIGASRDDAREIYFFVVDMAYCRNFWGGEYEKISSRFLDAMKNLRILHAIVKEGD